VHIEKLEHELWTPIMGFPERFHNCCSEFFCLDERNDTNHQLRGGLFIDIETYDKIQAITFLFDRVLFYSWSDNLRRGMTQMNVQSNHSDLHKYFIFHIEKSNLLNWFLTENEGLYTDERDLAIHYVVFTSDDFIDVISQDVPILFEQWEEK